MNCEQARELAALSASGDVTVTEQCALELHIAECVGCRAEAAGFALIARHLAEMRGESAPDYVYAAVRARVVAEVQRPRSGWLAAWPVLVGVLACGVMLVVLLRPAVHVVSHSEPRAKANPVPVASLQEPAQSVPVVLRSAPPRRRTFTRAEVRTQAEPLVVHMFTNDPDVVIYWIADAGRKRSEKEIIQ